MKFLGGLTLGLLTYHNKIRQNGRTKIRIWKWILEWEKKSRIQDIKCRVKFLGGLTLCLLTIITKSAKMQS